MPPPIETTHVHVLTGPIGQDVGKFAGRIKGASSSALLKRAENSDRNRIWTGGYWKVFLFDEFGMRCVQEYIEAHNVRRGLSPAPYPWISSF
jgi:REP element-mobilizing transposase RayT